MGEFVIFDPSAHRATFMELCEEYFNWMAGELQKNYGIDVSLMLGITLRDYVESNVDEFVTSPPSDGVLYLLREKEEIIGMGALRKLKKGTGEIKRMYIKPEYRGKGLGREMLQLLLNKGKEYGLSEIYLETGAFMRAAQGLYRSMGFHDRKEYPETEVPLQLRLQMPLSPLLHHDYNIGETFVKPPMRLCKQVCRCHMTAGKPKLKILLNPALYHSVLWLHIGRLRVRAPTETYENSLAMTRLTKPFTDVIIKGADFHLCVIHEQVCNP